MRTGWSRAPDVHRSRSCFNSLLEMLNAYREAMERLYRLIVSILYWRCLVELPPGVEEKLEESFNSLLEMLAPALHNDADAVSCFNSLLEMRDAVGLDLPAEGVRRGFNSLLEMPHVRAFLRRVYGKNVSILYWRCERATRSSTSLRVTRCFNSLLEMRP